MTEKRDPTLDEIASVVTMSSTDESILIGGMAVALLCRHYGIEIPMTTITTDADFFGGQMAIAAAEDNLDKMSTRTYLAGLDDAAASPSSGKIAVDIDHETNPVEIDFLYRIDGLSSDEIEQKAVTIMVGEKNLKVMHPILLLENKIINLAMFPGKRDEAGVTQAKLCLEIAKAYLRTMSRLDQKAILNTAERIARFANREAACFANKVYQIDVLDVFADLPSEVKAFQEIRLPQIKQHTAERRIRFDEMWARMEKLQDPRKSRFKP